MDHSLESEKSMKAYLTAGCSAYCCGYSERECIYSGCPAGFSDTDCLESYVDVN